jgi:phage-related protein
LPAEDRRAIGTDLATVQVGWPIGMPLCRPLGGGLWEVRSTLPSRRIARLLIFVHAGRIGVMHGFIKKTRKTPADDLDLARRRMKEMQA